jgi:hypothetical protein
VRWRPAVDVNRLFATIGAVAIGYLFTRAHIEKARVAIAITEPDRSCGVVVSGGLPIVFLVGS